MSCWASRRVQRLVRQLGRGRKRRIRTADPAVRHKLIPRAFQAIASGVSLALEVEDVDAAYSRFRDREDLVTHIADEEYGQRHFMCVDPNGVLVDVGMPIEPSDAFKAEYLENE